MSSETNVGLGRRMRLAYCSLVPLVGLFALATPLVGQAKPVPTTTSITIRSAPATRRHTIRRSYVLTPLFKEMVKRKAMCHTCCSPRLPVLESTQTSPIVEVLAVVRRVPSSGTSRPRLRPCSASRERRDRRLNELRRLCTSELYSVQVSSPEPRHSDRHAATVT